MSDPKALLLIDFDHTLYRRDSLLDFTRYAVGPLRYGFGVLTLSPWLVAKVLGLVSGETTKIRWITHFFKGLPYIEFEAKAAHFALHHIPRHLDKKLLQTLRESLHSHRCIIVTASCPAWIAPWAHAQGIEVIGTQLAVQQGRLTGQLATPNCNANEKVRRIEQYLSVADYEKIVVIGYGRGDQALHRLAR